MKEESLTTTLYSDLRSFSTKTSTRIADIVEVQVVKMERDVRTLLDKVCHLETELVGWKSTKRISEKTVKRLKATHLDIEEDLEESKDAFRPIWRMPSEVWVKIWKYVARQALDGYLKENPSNYGMKPPILNLSQVCSHWRYLVHNEPELWTLVYVAPTQVWRQCEHELLVNLSSTTVPVDVLIEMDKYVRPSPLTRILYWTAGIIHFFLIPLMTTAPICKEYRIYLYIDRPLLFFLHDPAFDMTMTLIVYQISPR